MRGTLGYYQAREPNSGKDTAEREKRYLQKRLVFSGYGLFFWGEEKNVLELVRGVGCATS